MAKYAIRIRNKLNNVEFTEYVECENENEAGSAVINQNKPGSSAWEILAVESEADHTKRILKEKEAAKNLAPPAPISREWELSREWKLKRTVSTTGEGFSTRAVAYVIDVIAINMVTFILYILFSLLVNIIVEIIVTFSGQKSILYEPQVPSLALLAVSVFYFTIFEWLYGATLGKVIFNMRVVKVNGERCGFKEAFIRALLRYVDALFFGIPAYVSMRYSMNQRIGDKVAKTLVVNAEAPIIQNSRAWWWFLAAGGVYLPIVWLYLLTLEAVIILLLPIMTIRSGTIIGG